MARSPSRSLLDKSARETYREVFRDVCQEVFRSLLFSSYLKDLHIQNFKIASKKRKKFDTKLLCLNNINKTNHIRLNI